MTLTIVQIATSALVALCFALALEPAPDVSVFTPDFLAALAYLVILASCVAMVVQNFGQSKVPPAQAALLLSMHDLDHPAWTRSLIARRSDVFRPPDGTADR